MAAPTDGNVVVGTLVVGTVTTVVGVVLVDVLVGAVLVLAAAIVHEYDLSGFATSIPVPRSMWKCTVRRPGLSGPLADMPSSNGFGQTIGPQGSSWQYTVTGAPPESTWKPIEAFVSVVTLLGRPDRTIVGAAVLAVDVVVGVGATAAVDVEVLTVDVVVEVGATDVVDVEALLTAVTGGGSMLILPGGVLFLAPTASKTPPVEFVRSIA